MFEDKYLHMLGIEKLQKSNAGYKGRCPVCGDSKKNPNKMRFYVYYGRENNNMMVECFNCNLHPFGKIPLGKFLKEFFPQHFDDYHLDYLKHNLGVAEYNEQMLEYYNNIQLDKIDIEEHKQIWINQSINTFQKSGSKVIFFQ